MPKRAHVSYEREADCVDTGIAARDNCICGWRNRRAARRLWVRTRANDSTGVPAAELGRARADYRCWEVLDMGLTTTTCALAIALLLVSGYAVALPDGGAGTGEYLDCSRMGSWDIIVDKEAIPSERYAAEEFQRFFAQATGVNLPIRRSGTRSGHHVYIGPGRAFDGSGFGFDTATMGEEELRVVVRPDRVLIAGGRPRGTLYGVYQFLEDCLGVRFLTFDHPALAGPDASRLHIACTDFAYRPPFSFRWSYYRENSEHPEFAARMRVNTVTPDERLGGNTRQSLINHSLYRWLPVSEYGQSHPEYFALVDGERKLDVGGGGPEPCVTNPEVIEIVAQAVIRELDADPGRRNISVSQNDNDQYCRCPRCEEINAREGTPMGSHLAFVNAVAERVEKKHPEVKIGTLAYWYTRKAPKTIVPRPNVQIQLCSIECCTLHAIDDPNCPRNAEFMRDLREWGKICDDIWVWNYNTNFGSYDLPFPNLRSIGPNVRCFLRNNVKGLFMQANGNGTAGEMSDLRNYIIARMIWNPQLDDRAVAEEFVRLHYRSAAGPILEYLNMLHDNAERSGLHPGCFPSAAEVGLRPEIAQRAFEYFEQALALADDEEVRARVEKASICAYKAMIEAGGPPHDDDGVLRMDLAPKYDDLIPRYIALCDRYHMTHAAESMPAAQYIERLELRARQAYHRSRQFREENDFVILPLEWRFRADPRRAGVDEGWYRSDFEDSDWEMVSTESQWYQQGREGLTGWGWGRVTFEVPESFRGRKVLLRVVSVDEQGWVYLNDQYLYHHPEEETSVSWMTPFEVDVTEAIRPGQVNTLAVLCYAESTLGGVWQPVVLYSPKTPAN